MQAARMSHCWQATEQGTDMADRIALVPTLEELEEVAAWLAEVDANPMWPG